MRISIVKIVLLSALYFNYANADCSMNYEQADKCAFDTMIFGNRKALIPSNDAELDQYCTNAKSNYKCLQDYIDSCLTGMAQLVSKKIMDKAEQDAKDRCDIPEERKDFLNYMKCFLPTSNGKAETLHQCSEKHIVMTEKIAEVPKEHKVASLCCTYQYVLNCFRTNIAKSCGKDVTEYFEKLFNDGEDDTTDLPCNDYSTVEKCEKNMNQDTWNILKNSIDVKSPEELSTKHKYKSVIGSMFELISQK